MILTGPHLQCMAHIDTFKVKKNIVLDRFIRREHITERFVLFAVVLFGSTLSPDKYPSSFITHLSISSVCIGGQSSPAGRRGGTEPIKTTAKNVGIFHSIL